MWRLTDRAADIISELEAEGIRPTPQEVLYIQQLSLDIVAPKTGTSLSRGVPKKVGGVTLWPLTIAGSMWFGDICEEGWVANSVKNQAFCMAFAMAFGHDTNLYGLRGIKARIAVKAWAFGIHCTLRELTDAISEVSGDELHIISPAEKARAANPSRAREAHLAQAACCLCGGTPEFWERACSMSWVSDLVRRGTVLKAAGEGAKLDESADALCRLAQYVQEIRESRKGGSK